VIGVLYLKNLTPGPMIFHNQPEVMTALFAVFFLANLLMLPFGWLAIKLSVQILRISQPILMPIIMIFCIVGAFAVTNSTLAVLIMLVFGIVGFVLEDHDFPVAPIILGIVLGPLLEQNFFNSMIKADGSVLAFFARPIAGALGICTILIWAGMVWFGVRDRLLRARATTQRGQM
jgi:putative tricarboxylic transport membrane protein